MNLQNELNKAQGFKNLELLAKQVVEGFIIGLHKRFTVRQEMEFLYSHANHVEWTRLYKMMPLTREFLLSRGVCCKRNCVNCPYGLEGKPTLKCRKCLEIKNHKKFQKYNFSFVKNFSCFNFFWIDWHNSAVSKLFHSKYNFWVVRKFIVQCLIL